VGGGREVLDGRGEEEEYHHHHHHHDDEFDCTEEQ